MPTESETSAIADIRFELGFVTDGAGDGLDDEAVIFFSGVDVSFEIQVRSPNATDIATKIVQLWNGAKRDQAAALEASWRETLAMERAVRLNEVRLKDEYRTRALAAERELAKLRAIG